MKPSTTLLKAGPFVSAHHSGEASPIAKSPLTLLPVEIKGMITSHLSDQDFASCLRSARTFGAVEQRHTFYRTRWMDQYLDKDLYATLKQNHANHRLPYSALHRVGGIYAKQNRFFLPKDRRDFPYIRQLRDDTPFQLSMFYTAARLGNIELFHSLYENYCEAQGEKTAALPFGAEVVEAAITSRYLPLVFALFEPPYSVKPTTAILIAALKSGHLKLVQSLLQQYPKAFRINQASLDAACESGNPELVEWLITKYPGLEIYGRDNLLLACHHGHLELVQWLLYLERRWHPFAKGTGKDALIRPACLSGNLQLVQWLYNYRPVGLEISQEDLESACRGGCFELVKWLTEGKHHTNGSRISQTSLDLACKSGSLELVEWLLEQYPDDLEIDRNNLYFACKSGNPELLERLLGSKQYTDDTDDLEITQNMLKEALSSGNCALAKWLLERYPDDLKVDQDILLHDVLGSDCDSAAELVQWSFEQYGDLPNDLAFNHDVLERVFSKGNLALAQWLYEKCSDAVNGALVLDQRHMEAACDSGSYALVSWVWEIDQARRLKEDKASTAPRPSL